MKNSTTSSRLLLKAESSLWRGDGDQKDGGQRLLFTSTGSLKVLESLVSNQTRRVDPRALPAAAGDTITERGHACPQAAVAISLPRGLTEQVVTWLQASVNEALTSAVNLCLI